MRAFCERCCFWSDTMAKHEHGTMFAMCLNVNSPKAATYTGEREACLKFVAGEPIDSVRLKEATR
jgi:hypothetical protein